MNAPVFGSKKNFSIMKGRSGHILVVGLVGEGVLPKQMPVLGFHTHKSPMVPSHNLTDAFDLGKEGG